MTITLGAWALPLLITIVTLIGYIIWEAKQPKSTGYARIGDGFISLVVLMFLSILNLVVWLIWAIFR